MPPSSPQRVPPTSSPEASFSFKGALRPLPAVAAAAARKIGSAEKIGAFCPGRARTSSKASSRAAPSSAVAAPAAAEGEAEPDSFKSGFILGSSNLHRPAPVRVPTDHSPSPQAKSASEPSGSSEGRAREVDQPASRWQQACIIALGLRPNAALWGRENYDWGIRSKVGKAQEEWYAESPSKNPLHDVPTWWTTAIHRVPHVRHLWGEAQYELHPGAQELFLDLIFVGVAFRIGSILKAAFYLCLPSETLQQGQGVGSYSQAECVGLPIGLLHSLSTFICMYMLWLIETSFRAKFNGWSKVHSVLDTLGNLMLLLAGMNMVPAHEYRGKPGSVGLTSVLIPLMASLALWTLRTLEMAFLGRRECARRQSSGEAIVYFQVMLLWAAALVVSCTDLSQHGPSANIHASDAAAALMWSGVIWWMWRRASGPLSRLHLPGEHLPLERSAVCNNMGFIAHRNNEFMFLMLGETVLQIMVTDGNISDGTAVANIDIVTSLFNATTATATAGLILALAMMFSFRQMVAIQLGDYKKANTNLAERVSQSDSLLAAIRKSTRKPSTSVRKLSIWSSKNKSPPSRSEQGSPNAVTTPTRRTGRSHSTFNAVNELNCKTLPVRPPEKKTAISEKKSQRLLIHMRAFNVVSTILFTTNALAVLLVGVGIKLAIHNPLASVDAHFALEQRLEVGVPCMVVFSIQLFNSLLKNSHHYVDSYALISHPAHVMIILTRVVFLSAKLLICFVPLQPVVLLSVEAVLAFIQCALLHVQEHRLRIVSARQPRSAGLPEALNNLREKARLHRDMQRSKLGAQLRASARVSAAANVPVETRSPSSDQSDDRALIEC